MNPDQAAALAVHCGAMVLGEAGTTQHFLLTAEQIVALVRVAAVPAIHRAEIPPPPH